MKKQSFITILLTALMSMAGATAYAHDIEVKNSDGKTIYYKWANEAKTELAVSYRGNDYTASSNRYTGEVFIPESVEYNGNTYPVTSIGNGAFYGCSRLTSVTIPNSVTSIGNSAFSGCRGLTSVKVPVTDFSTFCNNKIVNVISKSIQLKADDGQKISIPIQLIDKDGKEITEYIVPNDVTSIGNGAFYGCSRLTSVTIPNSVTSIGSEAFYNCSDLTSVTIPNSVTSIDNGAFYGCSRLTSVTIPNSVTSIGVNAFSYCRGLTSVTIPNSVTSIGSEAFYNCI